MAWLLALTGKNISYFPLSALAIGFHATLNLTEEVLFYLSLILALFFPFQQKTQRVAFTCDS